MIIYSRDYLLVFACEHLFRRVRFPIMVQKKSPATKARDESNRIRTNLFRLLDGTCARFVRCKSYLS